MTIINFPKIKYDLLFVYYSLRLIEFLSSLMDNNKEIYIRHEDGVSFSEFGTEGIISPQCEKASSLIEKSPTEVFPYIFNPEYTGNDSKIKWCLFSILKKENGDYRKCGYFFIHCFKVFKRKRTYRGKFTVYSPPASKAILFLFLGERGVVDHIKNEINLISVKVPSNILEIV